MRKDLNDKLKEVRAKISGEKLKPQGEHLGSGVTRLVDSEKAQEIVNAAEVSNKMSEAFKAVAMNKKLTKRA